MSMLSLKFGLEKHFNQCMYDNEICEAMVKKSTLSSKQKTAISVLDMLLLVLAEGLKKGRCQFLIS